MSVIQGNAFSDDAVDTGDIGHSLRCRSAASAYLNRTPAGAGDRTKWTWSGWVKRGALGTQQILFIGYAANNDSGYTRIAFNSSDALLISGYSTNWRATSSVYRDPTSPLHITLVYDSSNATADDRIKLFVTGVQITSFTTTNNPSSGQTSGVNAAAVHYISRNDSADGYVDGYLSRICFIDGAALTPSSFGYLNTDINEWVSKTQSAVKAVVDAGGTNSFMLDFDDATSLTTLGYDKSSKGNNWTLNNFSLTAGTTYDHMLDVPGNSFATLNPLNGYPGFVYDGNLKLQSSGANWYSTAATLAVNSGKWYWEIGCAVGATGVMNGVASVSQNFLSAGVFPGSDANGRGYYSATGNKYVSGGATAYGATYTTGDVIGFALDMDAGTITAYKNNVSQGVLGTGLSGYMVPAGSVYDSGSQVFANFGQRPFSYTPPTGFKALCQANLPDVAAAVLNPTDGFVAVTATEDNIDSTLASARSGWSDFVDVKKNLAAAESWAWQLSHDSTNEYAVSASSLVRQAKRAMSGSNTWEGFSIRIGASYGTAAGSVSHTNGVATTITHNIGVSARQMILLFNRAGGTAVPMYHPDLTSGELLDLCTTAADAASTAITSVLTNSFQIGSGVATGTYDYLVCSELSGLFDLGKWTGNASADGAYYDAGHKPSVLYAKALSTTDDHRVYNALRPGYNVIGGVVLANTTAAETTAAEMDFTSQGMKARITTTPNAAQTYVTASWASVAGKYSLGR